MIGSGDEESKEVGPFPSQGSPFLPLPILLHGPDLSRSPSGIALSSLDSLLPQPISVVAELPFPPRYPF